MSARAGQHIRDNIYGLLAVFIALTAGAYAASQAPKNSVTSKSIKNGQVKTEDVADDSLTGVDINESTLNGVQGPRGATGAQGAQGPQGTPGAAGLTGATGPAGTINGVAAGGDLNGTYPNPAIANAAVTIPKLSFDPATQTELNTHASSADHDGRYRTETELSTSDGNVPNTGSNFVHWNILTGVPAAFSDGTDDAGGNATGDLTGSYPNPSIAPNAVALTTDTTGNYVASVATDNGLTGAATGAEGSSGTLGLDYSQTTSSSSTLANETVFGVNGVLFEGGNSDAFETLLTPSAGGADRVITLPDLNGTVALTGNPASFTALTATSSLTVGTGPSVNGWFSGTASLDFPAVPANSCVVDHVTVTGAATGDTLALGVPVAATVADVNYTGYVLAGDTVTVKACNVATAASANPPAGTFRADVFSH